MRFDMVCEANDIEHRLAKPNHPWTNGQVEWMNRTIKEATVRRFIMRAMSSYGCTLPTSWQPMISPVGLRRSVASRLMLYEYIATIWTSESDRFIIRSDPPDARTKHLAPIGFYRDAISLGPASIKLAISTLPSMRAFRPVLGRRTSSIASCHSSELLPDHRSL
jgi:hypothetical protein